MTLIVCNNFYTTAALHAVDNGVRKHRRVAYPSKRLTQRKNNWSEGRWLGVVNASEVSTYVVPKSNVQCELGSEIKGQETRTNTNYRAIFCLFIVGGDGRRTEKEKSEEEEESERQARDEASCMRPCWTRHG